MLDPGPDGGVIGVMKPNPLATSNHLHFPRMRRPLHRATPASVPPRGDVGIASGGATRPEVGLIGDNSDRPAAGEGVPPVAMVIMLAT